MHGEYKMPGGKLVVADLEVGDGKLRNVRISGDFFLEPDTALTLIDVALDSLPATATGEEFATAVRATLGPHVRMFGISPESIAVAVQRALEAPP
ncbi:MAG TPA: biotin--protein ligase [Rhodanobacteraceae bacterium]|nr:biotin--protein ligase [Rhodanobacteraceae bacterium]